MSDISLFIDQLVNLFVSFGPLGGFILIILESFIAIIPLGAIVGINMLSFGNIFGFLLSYCATICGCMLSFFIFRYIVKDSFLKWFSKKNQVTIKEWMKKLTNIDFNVLVILFALPITPAFLVNIAGGLSDIKTRKYLLALLIGKPAMLLFYGYIAVSFAESLTDPIKLLRSVGLVLLAYIASKIIEKIVKVEK